MLTRVRNISRTVNDVRVIPADVAPRVVSGHGLGGEAQRRGAGTRVAEAAGAQADATQGRQLLHFPASNSRTPGFETPKIP